MKIKSLHIYPVKSGQGLDLQEVELRARGLTGDRRFMLVRKDGRFITQREKPQLAQLCVGMLESGITLKWPGSVQHIVNFLPADKRINVTVWRSSVSAVFVDDDINVALSDWLGMQVALVFMDKAAQRLANESWTKTPSEVSFADGYPVLVTTHASLGALNGHIVDEGGCPIPMTRFRPNIVIEGTQAWAENNWQRIKIGDVVLDLVKPCARCIMTSIDQASGEKHPKAALGSLKVLNPSTHPDNPGVIFGINSVPRTLGSINVGDEVEVII